MVSRVALALCALLPISAPRTLHADQLTPREQTVLLAYPEVRGLLRDGDLRVMTGVRPDGTS